MEERIACCLARTGPLQRACRGNPKGGPAGTLPVFPKRVSPPCRRLRAPRPQPWPARGIRDTLAEPSGAGLAKFAKLAKPAQMRPGLLRTSLRFLTWVCVGLLGLRSLLPVEDMARTGFPGSLEHFAAYAGSGAVAMAGYGLNRGAVRVIGCFWVYAGIQHFPPGRNPALVDFAASAIGALCGGVSVVLLWRWLSAPPGPRDTA